MENVRTDMGKSGKIIVLAIAAVIVGAFLFRSKDDAVLPENVAETRPTAERRPDAVPDPVDQGAPSALTEKEIGPPLDRASERITKKPFGIFVTPQDSPVRPERFRGFHSGTDFETFPEEQDVDVTVRAICDGTFRLKRHVSGYGGVAVEECMIGNRTVTVLYGHLKLSSVSPVAGSKVARGDAVGVLGKGYGPETDGERKHLHLSIRKGAAIEYRGYVGSKDLLAGWIDPCAAGACE